MKKKAILSAVLSLLLCASIVTGGTLAIFTSESQTNISISSGKVDVVATLNKADTDWIYSPTLIKPDGTVSDATNAADLNGTFKNQGTASLTDSSLILTNVNPGDKVNLKVNIKNNSNVTVKYQVVVATVANDGLFEGLVVTMDGASYDGKEYKSKWTTITSDVTDVATFPVSVELPTDAGNTYQDKSCTIVISVIAVQGNTEVSGPVGDVVDNDTLAAAIEAKVNYTVTEGTFTKVVIADGVEVTINGGTFKNQVIAARNGGTVIVNNALAGSGESGGGPNLLANVNGGSKVIINGGSYMTTTILHGDGTGTVEITGGYFDCGALYITFYGKPVANLTITGGTFSSMFVKGQGGMGPYIADFVPNTHLIVNNADGSITVVAK